MCLQRPLTLLFHHLVLHSWSLPQYDYIVLSFIEIHSGASQTLGVDNHLFPLVWLVAYTTA